MTPAGMLAAIDGLTQAESALLAALAEGTHAKARAEANALSPQALRTQIRHILAKTGHHRQTDLLRDIAADPILRALATPPEV